MKLNKSKFISFGTKFFTISLLATMGIEILKNEFEITKVKAELFLTQNHTIPTNEPVMILTNYQDIKSNLVSLTFDNPDPLQTLGRNLLPNAKIEKTSVNEFIQIRDMAPIVDKYGIRQYTISYEIKTPVVGNFLVYNQNGSDQRYSFGAIVSVTNIYQRYSTTVTPTLVSTSIVKSILAFYGTYGTGRIPTVKNVKIELGNKSTVWTSAFEDTDVEKILVDKNGTYQFTATDNVGGVSTKSITISNIDTILPIATSTTSETELTNNDVVITINGIDPESGIKEIKLPNGNIVTSNSATYTTSVNGIYNFEVFDNAGNKTVLPVTINNIYRPTLAAESSIDGNALSWPLADVVGVSYTIKRDGAIIYSGTSNTYFDSDVLMDTNYNYELETTNNGVTNTHTSLPKLSGGYDIMTFGDLPIETIMLDDVRTVTVDMSTFDIAGISQQADIKKNYTLQLKLSDFVSPLGNKIDVENFVIEDVVLKDSLNNTIWTKTFNFTENVFVSLITEADTQIDKDATIHLTNAKVNIPPDVKLDNGEVTSFQSTLTYQVIWAP